MGKIFFLFLTFLTLVVVPVRADQPPANGTVKEFFGNGHLKSILKYKNDELLRKRVYHEQGQLLLDTVYHDKTAIMIKSYYLNGQLKSVWTRKSGEARFFYPTGQPKITIPVRNPSRLEK